MYKKILSLSLAAAIILSSAATAVIPAYAADENPMGISSPTTGESSMKPEGGQDQGGTDQGGQEQEQGTWKVSFTGIERPFEYNTGNFRFPEYYTLKKKVVAWKNTVTGEEFKVGESHTPISDETYTPVWEDLAEVLKATFVDSNGETKTVDFQEDERGAFIIYPEPTSKTGPNGEVFIGWRRVGGDENSHIGLPGEKSYTNTLEYEAVWGTEKDLERTITFDANGGTGKQASMTVKVNEIFEMPECTFTAPEGKIFIGWKDQWDNICLPGDGRRVSENMSFTAVWGTEKDLERTITFDAGEGSGKQASMTVKVNERFEMPECTFTAPEGKIFIGWKDQWDNICLPGDGRRVSKNMSFTAVWGTEKDLERTITFDAGEGSGKQASMTVKVNERFEVPECTFTAPEGKIFIGWKDQWDNINLPGDGRRVSENMSFTAVWGTEKDLERTITFDAGEGSGKQASMTIKVNERFEMPECTFTAPEGKIFIGWKDQWDNICLPGDGRRARENMSFTAVWGTEKDLERTITFDAGEGSGKQASMTVKVNERFEVPKCTMTAPEGKQFLYWINEHNGHILFPGDEYGTNMNLKFTAVWGTEKDLERTVTPDANGGTGEMKPFIVKMNERFKVPECTFTAPEGKIFLYWLDPAGRKMYEHQEWGTYADMKMTAQWGTEADLEKCTITFDANGGTGKQASMTALEGKLFKLPSCTLTAPAGMEFKCWVDEYGREFNPGDQRWTNTSITLYAKWVKTEKPEPQPQPEPQPEVKPEPTPAQKKEEAKKAEAQRQEEEKKTVTEATDKVLDEISKLEIKADNKTNNKTEEKQEVLTVELKNVTEVKAETFAEVAKEAEKKNAKVEVKVDNVVGKKVVARITFDAAEAAKLKEPVKLGVKTDKAATKVVNNTFTKFFDNEIAVAKCEQEGKFGMNVRMAVKVNLEKLNKETLAFYSYDAKTNTFKKIKEPKYVVDKNGYVHFDTNLAGSIVITDKPLTLKKAK